MGSASYNGITMPETTPTLKDLRARRTPIRNVNREHRERLSPLERTALWVTKHIGSMGFFILVLLWTLLWLLWNTIGPAELRFDPFPAFVLWLFISNMIQLLLLPLLMIGQNLQGRHAEARAEADFEVNMQAEREIGAILEHLESQEEVLREIRRRLEKNHSSGNA